MNKLISLAVAGVISLPASSQAAFTVLHNFAGKPDGAQPYGTLTLAGGVLYGTTYYGGNGQYAVGSIFSLNPDGSNYTPLHGFGNGGSFGDGNYGLGDLVLSGNTLYAATQLGGSSARGTVYKINTNGTGYAILRNMGGGSDTYGGTTGKLALSDTGTLYGMTTYGGASGNGTIYKINTAGTGYGILHSFAGGASDGYGPNGPVILSGSTLYGMTSGGGGNSRGTIFKMNVDGGAYSLVHSFGSVTPDCGSPRGSLLLLNNTLYGMTNSGGGIFSVNTDGSNYQYLKGFNTGGQASGNGTLISVGDFLYGMEYGGGGVGGYIFRYDTAHGILADIFNFSGTTGSSPYGSLTPIGNTLYGMTAYGGSKGNGTIFSFDIPNRLSGTSSINSTTSLDVPNSLIIDYAGASPIASIRGYLASGCNNGEWNGMGVSSSTAAADHTYGTAVGYADATDLALSIFDGQPVSSTDIVLKSTAYGDANLDGKVDAADFGRFLDGLASGTGSTWAQGDFTYDGVVDLGNDFTLFLHSYLAQGSALGDLAGPIVASDLSAVQKTQLLAVIPEPSMLTALMLGIGVLLIRRRSI